MKVFVALCLLVCFAETFAQAKAPTDATKLDYSEGIYQGEREIRIFPDDPRKFRFTLSTSWIPGPQHKGMFRYQLEVGVVAPTPSDLSGPAPEEGWGLAETIDRLQKCQLNLRLLDGGGFLVQTIPLWFARSVDDHSAVKGLSANDASQMDLSDYRSFLKPGAGWEMSWSCGHDPKPTP
jgi:hypothetical protein